MNLNMDFHIGSFELLEEALVFKEFLLLNVFDYISIVIKLLNWCLNKNCYYARSHFHPHCFLPAMLIFFVGLVVCLFKADIKNLERYLNELSRIVDESEYPLRTLEVEIFQAIQHQSRVIPKISASLETVKNAKYKTLFRIRPRLMKSPSESAIQFQPEICSRKLIKSVSAFSGMDGCISYTDYTDIMIKHFHVMLEDEHKINRFLIQEAYGYIMSNLLRTEKSSDLFVKPIGIFKMEGEIYFAMRKMDVLFANVLDCEDAHSKYPDLLNRKSIFSFMFQVIF